MFGLRLRLGAIGAVLCAAVLCFSLQPAGLVTAEDQAPGKPPAKSGAAAASDKAKAAADAKKSAAKAKKDAAKKKGGAGVALPGDQSAPQTQSSAGGSAPTGSAVGATIPAQSAGGKPTSSPTGNSTGGGTSNAGGNGNGAMGKPNAAGGQGGQGGQGAKANNSPDQAVVDKVMAIQKKHTPELLKQEGVVGTSTGLAKGGKVVVRVYLTGAGKPVIPAQLDGVDVETKITGQARSLSGFAGSSQYNPQTRLPRPVPIGVSSFNENSPACNGSICATGTLGCRLQARDGSGTYALSNNHVYADENAAAIGNDVVQPGPFDNGCVCVSDDIIGKLAQFRDIDFTLLSFNIIDAAIIKTSKDLVSNQTLPDGYGKPRTTIIQNPQLGMKVQKYGRTTGYTKGTITGLNQIVLVLYPNGLAFFDSQLEITGDGGLFSDAGDSGSLIVTDDRFPVALLFAGLGPFTSANPIGAVLDAFGMNIDGDDSQDFVPPGKTGSSTN